MNYTLFLQAFQSKYKGINDKQLLFQYLREELQYLILYVLFTKSTYPIYFMGGTKLRLSYGINRFSEDIDFALDKANPNFPSEEFFSAISKAFSEEITGFKVHCKSNAKRNVIKMTLSFEKLLHDLELSPLPSQTIKIKIELDTNPPEFAQFKTTTYRSFAGDYMIQTHDLETGFAGKIGAVLHREYQKGRDYYDLQWYLQHQPTVKLNLPYLNANCKQQEQKTFENEKEVMEALNEKVRKLDIVLLRQDLERFVTMDAKTFDQWLNRYIPETLDLLKAHQTKDENR